MAVWTSLTLLNISHYNLPSFLIYFRHFVVHVPTRHVSPDFHWQKSSSTVGRDSFHENRLGYLDVALQKICETRMQSCAIDSRQRLFGCSHCGNFFVSETREKWSRKYLVSESRVHHKDIMTRKYFLYLWVFSQIRFA